MLADVCSAHVPGRVGVTANMGVNLLTLIDREHCGSWNNHGDVHGNGCVLMSTAWWQFKSKRTMVMWIVTTSPLPSFYLSARFSVCEFVTCVSAQLHIKILSSYHNYLPCFIQGVSRCLKTRRYCSWKQQLKENAIIYRRLSVVESVLWVREPYDC